MEGTSQSAVSAAIPDFSRRFLYGFGISSALAESTQPLANLLPRADPVNCLAQRIDAMEKKMRTGTPHDWFQVVQCIHFLTGEQPTRIPLPGTSKPRLVDYDLLAQLICAYRVLDVRLARSGAAQMFPRLPGEDPNNSMMPDGHHYVRSWPALVTGLPDLLQDIRGGELSTRRPNDLVTLARNTVRAGGQVHLSKIFGNLYTSAMYLVCLCDPSGVEDPFTMEHVKNFFKGWHTRTANDPENSMTASECRRFRQLTSTVTSLKAIQACFEAVFVETPLLLFERFELSSRKCTRQNMLQASRARIVRNNKPATLQSFETVVLTAVLDLAFSESTSCSQVLTQITDAVREISFEDDSTVAPHWFDPDALPASNPERSPTPESHLQMDSELQKGEDAVQHDGQFVKAGNETIRGTASLLDNDGRPAKRRRVLSASPSSLLGADDPSTPSETRLSTSTPIETSSSQHIQSSDVRQQQNASHEPSSSASAFRILPGSSSSADVADNAMPRPTSVSPLTTAPPTGVNTPSSAELPSSVATGNVPLGSTPGLSHDLKIGSGSKEKETETDGMEVDGQDNGNGKAQPETMDSEAEDDARKEMEEREKRLEEKRNKQKEVDEEKKRKKEIEERRKREREEERKREEKEEERKKKEEERRKKKEEEEKKKKKKKEEEAERKKNAKNGGKGKGKDKNEPGQDEQEVESEDEIELVAEPLPDMVLEGVFDRLRLSRETNFQAPPFVPSTRRATPTKSSKRTEGVRAVTLYDIEGKPIKYTPCMSDPELNFFYDFADAIETFYVDDKPMHVARPDQSGFKGFTKVGFDGHGATRLRQEFSKQCFVVRDNSFQSPGFLPPTLQEFSPLNQSHVVHDYSLGEIGSDRFAAASMQDIYNEHVRGNDGKIVNLLDLSMNAAIKPHPLYTDVTASMATSKSPLPKKIDYPQTRFVIVATKDASHGWHHDSDGFCTFITPLTGLKLWVIAIPLDPSATPLAFFGDLIQFIREWSQTDPNCQRYRLEAVVLCPGDTLYLRALVSHVVFTLQSSICVGGHFYCATTMSDSIASLITSLLLEPRITNTEHINSRHLLHLMAVHCHEYVTAPSNVLRSTSELGFELGDFERWHSFVMLHVAVVLGPVLDPRFYKSWNKKAVDETDCLMLAYARGAALITIERLTSSKWLKIKTEDHPNGRTPQEYFDAMLVETAVLYLHAFTYVGVSLDANVTYHMPDDRFRVKKLLRQALSHDQDILARFDADINDSPPKKKPRKLFSIPLPDKTGKVIMDNRMQTGGPKKREAYDSYTLIQRGVTWELKKYIQGYHDNNIAKKEE